MLKIKDKIVYYAGVWFVIRETLKDLHDIWEETSATYATLVIGWQKYRMVKTLQEIKNLDEIYN